MSLLCTAFLDQVFGVTDWLHQAFCPRCFVGMPCQVPLAPWGRARLVCQPHACKTCKHVQLCYQPNSH
jgi:hypothetical protein